MEKIKTIGDLRNLIASQGGEIKLGKINISCGEKTDIDFFYEGKIMQWIPSIHSDELEINCSEIYSHIHEFGYQKEEKHEEKIEEKENNIVEDILEKKKSEDRGLELVKAQGAAEVLERLLMGRKVTLEN